MRGQRDRLQEQPIPGGGHDVNSRLVQYGLAAGQRRGSNQGSPKLGSQADFPQSKALKLGLLSGGCRAGTKQQPQEPVGRGEASQLGPSQGLHIRHPAMLHRGKRGPSPCLLARGEAGGTQIHPRSSMVLGPEVRHPTMHWRVSGGRRRRRPMSARGSPRATPTRVHGPLKSIDGHRRRRQRMATRRGLRRLTHH